MSEEIDVVVVGGGPGGLTAALAAARAGARVVLLDGCAAPGGQYYRQPPDRLRTKSNHKQREGRRLWESAAAAGVEIRSQRLVWSADSSRSLAVSGPEGEETLQAKTLILATGAYERLVPFPGWTLPGVITSGAAQTLLYQDVKPGKRVLLAGSGPLQLVTAADLIQAGVEVAGVLEGADVLRNGFRRVWAMWGQWERIKEGGECLLSLARHGVGWRSRWGMVKALGSSEVEGAVIARLDGDWRPIPGTEETVTCDTICVGYSFVPFNALSKLVGAEQVWRPELGGEVPVRDDELQTSIGGIFAIGDGAGIGGYRMALIEGEIAGLAAAAKVSQGGDGVRRAIERLRLPLRREQAFQQLYSDLFTPGPGVYELASPDTLVCRCEGVTRAMIEAAAGAGASNLIEVKALTRCGMGECQGRVCGSTVNAILARLAGKTAGEVGSFPARPPLFPLPLETFEEKKRVDT